MDTCLAAAALGGLDRRALQRSARLGREVLERAQRRAVPWPSQELLGGTVGVLCCGRRPAPAPQHLSREKYYSTAPEEGGASHVYRYHRRKLPDLHVYSDTGLAQRRDTEKSSLGLGDIDPTPAHAREAPRPAKNTAKDLYIEVYPGTYSVTVGSNALTKKTHVVEVEPGQSVDLVFPL